MLVTGDILQALPTWMESDHEHPNNTPVDLADIQGRPIKSNPHHLTLIALMTIKCEKKHGTLIRSWKIACYQIVCTVAMLNILWCTSRNWDETSLSTTSVHVLGLRCKTMALFEKTVGIKSTFSFYTHFLIRIL